MLAYEWDQHIPGDQEHTTKHMIGPQPEYRINRTYVEINSVWYKASGSILI